VSIKDHQISTKITYLLVVSARRIDATVGIEFPTVYLSVCRSHSWTTSKRFNV